MGVHVPTSQGTRGAAGLRELSRRGERWPVGRIAAIAVAVLWVVIVGAVLVHWVSYAAAPFFAAAAFTLVIVLVLAYDAVVDWADPDEHESLARRLQPEQAWPQLQGVAGLIRVWAVPACFVAGVVVGHFVWH